MLGGAPGQIAVAQMCRRLSAEIEQPQELVRAEIGCIDQELHVDRIDLVCPVDVRIEADERPREEFLLPVGVGSHEDHTGQRFKLVLPLELRAETPRPLQRRKVLEFLGNRLEPPVECVEAHLGHSVAERRETVADPALDLFLFFLRIPPAFFRPVALLPILERLRFQRRIFEDTFKVKAAPPLEVALKSRWQGHRRWRAW